MYAMPRTTGARNPRAKLTDSDVTQIRVEYSRRPGHMTQKVFCQVMAPAYGVAWQTIRGVVQGVNWREVQPS